MALSTGQQGEVAGGKGRGGGMMRLMEYDNMLRTIIASAVTITLKQLLSTTTTTIIHHHHDNEVEEDSVYVVGIIIISMYISMW